MIRMNKPVLLISLLALVALAGCSQQLLRLDPGRVTPEHQAGTVERWNMWIRTVTDARTDGRAGTTEIGSVGQRFDDTPSVVEMEELPADYVRKQLSLFLLNAGLEASSEQKARVLMDVTINQFELGRDTAEVLDKLTFEINYEIAFYKADGTLLGSVRLPESRWVKKFSPFGDERENLESLVRDSMNSTITSLAGVKLFKEAAAL